MLDECRSGRLSRVWGKVVVLWLWPEGELLDVCHSVAAGNGAGEAVSWDRL